MYRISVKNIRTAAYRFPKVDKTLDFEKVMNEIIRNHRWSISCSELVKFVKKVFIVFFNDDSIIFDDDTKKQHLRYRDPLTGGVFGASCSSGGKHGQSSNYNPSDIQRHFAEIVRSFNARKQVAEPIGRARYEWETWLDNPDDEINEASNQSKLKLAKNHGGLDDWFKKENWVDVSRPKKKGKGFEPCGRGNTSKGKKPVCTPSNKAKNLTERERKNRIRQKRRKEKEPNPDKKPNNTNYTEQAGGKSNVSENQNIRFVGSRIPLAEIQKKARFVKIALMGEEYEDITTPMPESLHHEKIAEDIIDFVIEQGSKMMPKTEIEKLRNLDLSKVHNEHKVQFLQFIRHLSQHVAKEAIEQGRKEIPAVVMQVLKDEKNPLNYSDVIDSIHKLLEKNN
jgi:hypothetical protein